MTYIQHTHLYIYRLTHLFKWDRLYAYLLLTSNASRLSKNIKNGMHAFFAYFIRLVFLRFNMFLIGWKALTGFGRTGLT